MGFKKEELAFVSVIAHSHRSPDTMTSAMSQPGLCSCATNMRGWKTRDLARAFTTSWQPLSSLIFNYLRGQSQDITSALRGSCVSLYSEITVKTQTLFWHSF